jgi:hypothetical protein
MAASPVRVLAPVCTVVASRPILLPLMLIFVFTEAFCPLTSPCNVTGYGQRRCSSASSGPRSPSTETAISPTLPRNCALIGDCGSRACSDSVSIAMLVTLPVAPSR